MEYNIRGIIRGVQRGRPTLARGAGRTWATLQLVRGHRHRHGEPFAALGRSAELEYDLDRRDNWMVHENNEAVLRKTPLKAD
jgi:hypothetical protein